MQSIAKYIVVLQEFLTLEKKIKLKRAKTKKYFKFKNLNALILRYYPEVLNRRQFISDDNTFDIIYLFTWLKDAFLNFYNAVLAFLPFTNL